MSFWAKLGVTIQDLGCFKQSCEKWDIDFEVVNGQKFRGYDVHAILKDRKSYSTGYLVKDGGAFKVMIDTDPNYSAITKRCGTKLTRDYTVNIFRKGAMVSGSIINGMVEQPDGSIIMKIGATG